MGRKRLAKNKDFPPNLYKNPAGYFYYKNPQTGKQKGLGRDRAHAFSEARAANAVLATMKPSSLADWVAGKTAYTFAEWLPVYKQLWTEETDPTAATMKLVEFQLRRLDKAEFAPRRLPDVSTEMIATYLEKYKVDHGATSAKTTRSRLSDIFRWAETQGLISAGSNPVTATRAPKVVVVRERMSLEQFMAIRAKAPTWLRNAMNLALVTGQRREDVLTMKFADWRDGRLHVAQEKSRGRTRLALDGSVGLVKAGLTIASVIKECRDLIASPYIVHHTEHRGVMKPGNRISGNGLSQAFINVREAAGITAKEGRTPVSFHEIRSLSERLYREQYGADFAQAIMGHKSAKTTSFYDDHRGEWRIVTAA